MDDGKPLVIDPREAARARVDEWRRALLAATAKSLDLEPRAARRFRMRGWALDDRCAVAIAAVCCVKLRCGLTRFRIAPGADDPPEWAKLVGQPTSEQIVEALELRDLLEPEKLAVVG